MRYSPAGDPTPEPIILEHDPITAKPRERKRNRTVTQTGIDTEADAEENE